MSHTQLAITNIIRTYDEDIKLQIIPLWSTYGRGPKCTNSDYNPYFSALLRQRQWQKDKTECVNMDCWCACQTTFSSPDCRPNELACMGECDGKRNVGVGENVKQEGRSDCYRCPGVRFEVWTE
jgi:hypothetical protein